MYAEKTQFASLHIKCISNGNFGINSDYYSNKTLKLIDIKDSTAV